jgi:alkanesulfonate monooxygenase SsuD/methylene tetrahydromethanopterin reductase-like flavin-dependent oxidoreductase (luciferase family)
MPRGADRAAGRIADHPQGPAGRNAGPTHKRFYRIDGLDLDVLPAPRPDSPRLLVGAGGPTMLRLAGRHADIVGAPLAPIPGLDRQRRPPGPAARGVRRQDRRGPRGRRGQVREPRD